MEKLRIEDIEGAANAIRRVKSIDKTIGQLGQSIEDQPAYHGGAIRKTFGQNILTQLRDEELGQIAFCAIVNALLKVREEEKEGFGEIVDFPPPPCPEQVWPSRD
ncbi:hypothetical protein [Roseibium alexandrii]|uniref:hypothetical protein n=1 Tax=Roseibium alexandrii TaxID=388408 RepID=UPI003751DF56